MLSEGKIKSIIRKSLIDLYKQQYGENPLNSFELGLDSVIDDMHNDSYWKGFQVDYPQLETKDLLGLLNSARKDLNQIKDTSHLNYIKNLTKIITALKSELATREHVSNKKEREEIRKQKMFSKKHK